MDVLVVEFKRKMQKEESHIHQQSIEIEKHIKFQVEAKAKNEVRA